MADQGGHGGVTPNEVSTPMVFITDKKTSSSLSGIFMCQRHICLLDLL